MINTNNLAKTLFNVGKSVVEYSQYYEELENFKKEWTLNSNESDVAITVVMGRRQLDGKLNYHGDNRDGLSESLTFGINRGQIFDRNKYIWFEYMTVKSITIKPHVGVIMETPGVLNYNIYLFNDTDRQQIYEWSYFLQSAVRTVQVVNTTDIPVYNIPGTFNIYDPIYRKRSVLGLAFVIMFLTFILFIIVRDKLQNTKQSFESNINDELN